MKRKTNRRPQALKVPNKALSAAMLELRQGSRTSPVPSGNIYKRQKAGAKGRDW